RRVTTSPRRIRSDAPSTAGASPNALLTPSRARTVSALPGSVAPTAAPRLLHHRLGEVLRLHHFRQVLLGVDLVELGAPSDRQGPVPPPPPHPPAFGPH